MNPTLDFEIEKWHRGCYRVRVKDHECEVFGQVKRNDIPNAETGSIMKGWLAEIRYVTSGDLKQYAGIWRTKFEAVAEVQWELEKAIPTEIDVANGNIILKKGNNIIELRKDQAEFLCNKVFPDLIVAIESNED